MNTYVILLANYCVSATDTGLMHPDNEGGDEITGTYTLNWTDMG